MKTNRTPGSPHFRSENPNDDSKPVTRREFLITNLIWLILFLLALGASSSSLRRLKKDNLILRDSNNHLLHERDFWKNKSDSLQMELDIKNRTKPVLLTDRKMIDGKMATVVTAIDADTVNHLPSNIVIYDVVKVRTKKVIVHDTVPAECPKIEKSDTCFSRDLSLTVTRDSAGVNISKPIIFFRTAIPVEVYSGVSLGGFKNRNPYSCFDSPPISLKQTFSYQTVSIDYDLQKRAKIEGIAGLVLRAGGMIGYSALYHSYTPKVYDLNGLGVNNPQNKFYDKNQESKKISSRNQWIEGGIIGAYVLGEGLGWDSQNQWSNSYNIVNNNITVSFNLSNFNLNIK